jgi:hypothetical protein
MLERVGPYVPGICDKREFGVYQGDAWELARDIPDYSIDLIWTDPEYNRDEDYKRLAELAQRILKPTGHLLVFYGIGYTEATYRALREGGMPVKWEFVVWQPGQTGRAHAKIFIAHYNMLWCPRSAQSPLMVSSVDLKVSHMSGMRWGRSTAWAWRKNPQPIAEWIPTFCPVDGVILDTFSGMASIAEAAVMTGRRFLAFERDEEKVEWSRDWLVNNVQPAMFAPDNEGYQTLSLLGAIKEADGDEAVEPGEGVDA